MIHVGILGAGNISETHARAARETEGVRVVAVHGRNRERAERLAETYGGSVYADLDSFLAHRPLDAVLVGSPSGLHAEQGIAAARRGLHVLVEKPLDISTERADALIGACEQAGVKLGVFFQDRAAPDVRRLKELVASGGLGRPILVSGRLRWYRPPEYYRDSRWRGTWALDGGGALMNQGVHTLDLLLWLLGDVKSVYARAVTALHDIEVEDTVAAVFEFESGAVGTFEAATSAYPGYPRRLELTGTEGTVILEQNRLVAADLRTPREGLLSASEESGGNPSASSPVVSDVSGHREILADFLRAVETGGTPICDGRGGRKSVALAQAVYESSRTGRAVGVS
jgi:UDP-N-acetyl-2-amino-2-deoxyglucuronate dehydrogenase